MVELIKLRSGHYVVRKSFKPCDLEAAKPVEFLSPWGFQPDPYHFLSRGEAKGVWKQHKAENTVEAVIEVLEK